MPLEIRLVLLSLTLILYLIRCLSTIKKAR
nr:MAG TPA: hypothetical protein [Caudoviricetes sp.]